MKHKVYHNDEDILEHLTVSDGKPQYIDSNKTKSQSTDKSKKQKTASRKEGTYEGHYEEQYEKYCIHQKRNVNQGVDICDIDQDLTKCASCPYRKSQVIRKMNNHEDTSIHSKDI